MARRNKHGLPLHVSPARDRHNVVRLRFRKGLFSTYLKEPIDTPEFWEEYRAALDGVRAAERKVGATRHKPGSIASVVLAYFQSPDFLGLRPSTQAVRRNILNRFVEKHGEKPVAGLQKQHLKAILGAKAATPHAANNLLRVVRVVLEFAVELEIIQTNPARGMKGFRAKTVGATTWSEADIAAYESKHPIGTRPRLAMALLLYTGQRRGDVVKMGWQHCRGDKIVVRQEKTGATLTLKIHKALADALEGTSRTNMTFLMTAAGAPFSAAGFGNAFRDWCDEAGLSGDRKRSGHGLRKAAARRLAEAGNSTKSIQSITGHTTLQEVELYTRAVDQELLADSAVESMPDRSDREQDLSNCNEGLDKTAHKALK